MNTVTKTFSKHKMMRLLTQSRSRTKQSCDQGVCMRSFQLSLDRFLNEKDESQSKSLGSPAIHSSFINNTRLCPATMNHLSSSLSLSGPLIRRLHSQNHSSIRLFSTMNGTKQKGQESSKDNKENIRSLASSDSPDSKTNNEKMQNAAEKGKEAMTKGATSVRALIQKYGFTFVGTYMGIYFVTLGALFAGLDSGFIDPISITSIELPWHASGTEEGTNVTTDREDFHSGVDFVVSYMKKFPWTAPYTDYVLRNPHLANLGLAWVATKLTEPIRLPVSIAIVRKIKKDE